MKDPEILKLLVSKPDSAIKYLIDKYGGLVYTIVWGKIKGVGTSLDAEECVSDVFAEFYSCAGSFDCEKSSIKTFISVIAARRAVSLFRKLERERVMIADTGDDFSAEDMPSDENIQRDVEEAETRKELLDAVRDLGEPDSTIIACRYFLDLKESEIAARVGMSRGAVQKRITRALQKLKEKLGGVIYG